jgi:hypothetical protein
LPLHAWVPNRIKELEVKLELPFASSAELKKSPLLRARIEPVMTAAVEVHMLI